ncbi:MAG: NADH-quinone oxidoreductase subunit M [Chloroflexi bacterium HGW-Chloroflexi-10]|nr:MAG: NADH-quinone oxidoreductase subunit M [Chloroflexi bacterium HGW-Chloroflexi-10]
MGFPILSVIIFIPLIAGLVILFIGRKNEKLIRPIALFAASVVLVLTLVLWASYSITNAGYQFIEKITWLSELGISYHLGVDGIGIAMLLLTGLVVFTGVLVSWNIQDRAHEFFAYLMFLASSVLGVFSSLDLFLLFFFLELAVFPKYLMIVIWGSPKTRNYGGMKLTLYLFIGSVIALVGVLAIYFSAPMRTFDLLVLENAGFSTDVQRLWFPFIFLGFAILGGIFPFHSWAPDGHVAAPTAISMLLAGVEMKVGVFAALRVAITLLPEGAMYWSNWILVLATINVIYGAFIAMIQKDFKYVIGFSSVSHMGLVLIGFASLNSNGLLGAGMQMFSHGIMTALFFSIVGMVYDRTHTRDIVSLGGLVKKMPFATIGFIIGGLVSMGMPGLSGFVAEIPIYLGVWQVAPWVAIVSALSIVITAAYILLVVRKVFFGEMPVFENEITDITFMDKIAISVLSLFMIVIGLFPDLTLGPLIESSVKHILVLLGGA